MTQNEEADNVSTSIARISRCGCCDHDRNSPDETALSAGFAVNGRASLLCISSWASVQLISPLCRYFFFASNALISVVIPLERSFGIGNVSAYCEIFHNPLFSVSTPVPRLVP